MPDRVQKFKFNPTEISGLIRIDTFCAEDLRGYVLKDYSEDVFAQNGIRHDLREVFYTSSHKGVIRAIHFQRVHQQPKLIRVVKGSVYDVVVDLRKNSPTFGKWQYFYLNEENKSELLIPGGCGHGYLVLEDSIVSYKCSEIFYGEYDDGIMWNDPDIGIKWPLDRVEHIILAEKDKHLQTFKEFVQKYGGLN